MKKQKKNFSFASKDLFLPVAILISIALFFLDGTKILQPLRVGTSFLFEPIAVDGNNLGGKINEHFGTIVKISEFRKEFNQMKLDMYEKDVNNSYYTILLEERDSLKKQLELGDSGQKLLPAKVLGGKRNTSFSINVGQKDGVAVGDTVLLGNLFLGVVERVDMQGCKVSLPTAKSSSYEAFITKKGAEQGKIVKESVEVLSKALIQGVGDHIRIENISTDSAVEDGDIVVVGDPKVSGFLVVGKIAGLSSNPAQTSRSGKVVPLIDYDDLMSVFVNIK